MSEESFEVVVVGAGPVGLTTALLLRKRGVKVAVVEKSTGPVTESRAIWVHPRTLEIWQSIGMSELALAEGKLVAAIEMHVRGIRKAALPYDGTGYSNFPHGLMLEQSRTQTLLAGLAEDAGIPIAWGSEVLNIENRIDHCEIQIDSPKGKHIVQAAFVVGADGGSSIVRHVAKIDLEGGTYDSSFFVADVIAETELDSNRSHLNFSGASTVAVLPLPGANRFRLVGNIIDQSGESREAGYGRPLSLDEVKKLVNANDLPMKILEKGWTTTYRSHHRVAESFRAGRLLLAGDASHLHSPAGGLGMNTGIADAENLAWRLADRVGGTNDNTLDQYSTERRAAAEYVIRTSDRLFELQASTKKFFVMMRTTRLPLVVRWISRTTLGKRIAFFALSGTRVRYPAPNSPRKKLGRMRAGALLPHTDNPELNAMLGAARGRHVIVALGESLKGAPQWESTGGSIHIVDLTSQHATSLTGLSSVAGYAWVRPDGFVQAISDDVDIILDLLHRSGIAIE